MTGRRLSRREVERLLRETLRDDLPEELEEELLRGLRPAWQRAGRAHEAPDEASGARPRALALPRLALAAALAACAAGLALHLAVPSSGSAGPLLLSREAAATALALGRVTAMTAVVEEPRDGGRPRITRVAWSAARPRQARLLAEDGTEGGAVGAGGGESILDVASERPPGPRAEDLAAATVPGGAAGAATPRRLAALLAGAWRAEPSGGAPGSATFRVGPEGTAVIVDLRTHLPVRVEHPGGVSVLFEWKTGPSPSLLGGGP